MIDDDGKLTAVLASLENSPWLALDTEADSLHAYPEKVCLIQISCPVGDYLVDPLSPINLDPLFRLLGTRELLMHGADYDLRLLHKHHDFIPRGVFDTMIASRLLGVTQFGLNNLLTQYLGVTLDKGSQKADWAQRPLTERMEKYARNDTLHLKPLVDRLRADLESKHRLAWHQESCARLVADCSQTRLVDSDLVWRLKGSNRFAPAALAVLRELWHWREDEAIAANRPPFFVISHETLFALAVAAVDSRPVDPLIPRRFSDRRRHGLLHAIRNGLAVPESKFPQPIPQVSHRVSDATKRRAAALQKTRDARATELGIDPTLIASRSTLMALAENWDANQAELMNWQRELLQ